MLFLIIYSLAFLATLELNAIRPLVDYQLQALCLLAVIVLRLLAIWRDAPPE